MRYSLPHETTRLILFRRSAARGDAVGEESVGHYLGGLPPRHIVTPSEVRAVLLVAWLVRHRPTRVARHHPSVGQTHDPDVEGVVLLYVGVEDARYWLLEARRVGDDLGELSTRGVFRCPEVGSVLRRVARLRLP